jgi:hypothetical protein
MGKDRFEEILVRKSFKTLVASQSGLVAARQLQEFGLNKTDIHRAKKAGRIKRILPSVYELEDSKDRWRKGLQAAVLWLPTGVISHRAALKLHALDGVSAAPVELSVAKLTAKKKAICVHRPRRSITDLDRTIIDGLPVTSVARTLVDVASVLSPGALAEAVESAFSDAFGVGRIDFAFPEHGIALETRGAETHSGEVAFEKDSHRTTRLTALGWTVVPVTWKMLETDTPGVVRMLRDMLDRHTHGPLRRPDPTAVPREQLLLFGST